MKSRDWLDREGGPLVMLSKSSAPLWRGDDEQYDQACAIDGVTGTLPVAADDAAFVIADEPLTACYMPEHSAIVQWIYADSESDVDGLFLAEDTEWYEEVEWSGVDPILFEAVLDGGRLESGEYIDIPGIDGVYSIRSADVTVSEHAAFRVHQFTYVGPRSA